MKIVDIVFWSIIIVDTIFNFKDNISNLSGMKECILFGLEILILFPLLSIVSLLKWFWLTLIYLYIKISRKNFKGEKLEKIDFKNDSYYRDIITQYSPGVLSYIDDFTIGEKDIVATIMSLELKNKIKIGDEIEVIDATDENLDENEKYILNKITDRNIKDIDIEVFEKNVISDCLNDGLLEEIKDIEEIVIKRILKCVFIYIWLSMLDSLPYGESIPLWLAPVIIFAKFIFPIIAIIYIISVRTNIKLNPYIRNKKSKDINLKLEGLKKYMKDYSLLNQKSGEEINIWEDYLIYSVIFGQNTELVDEIRGKLKNC